MVLRLLDADGDGTITRSELNHLYLLAQEFAAREQTLLPKDLSTLVTALFLGFDRERLRLELSLQAAAGTDLRDVEEALKVSFEYIAFQLCRVCA